MCSKAHRWSNPTSRKSLFFATGAKPCSNLGSFWVQGPRFSMEKRRIGSLEVSVVGIGCNNFGHRIDEPRTAEVFDAALDQGVNFFDTADIYGHTRSEEFLGRIIGARRSRIVLATKFGMEVSPEKKG